MDIMLVGFEDAAGSISVLQLQGPVLGLLPVRFAWFLHVHLGFLQKVDWLH